MVVSQLQTGKVMKLIKTYDYLRGREYLSKKNKIIADNFLNISI